MKTKQKTYVQYPSFSLYQTGSPVRIAHMCTNVTEKI